MKAKGDCQLRNYAVYSENSGGKTAEVGSKQPNEFRLYDMSGNAWEWMEDCWHDTYQGAPTAGTARPEASEHTCVSRVFRGGFWRNAPNHLRASTRRGDSPNFGDYATGFRLAQDIE